MTGEARPKVLVTGDLCLDNVIFDLELGGVNRIYPGNPRAGGSAFNAALAFKRAGFEPIVSGAVGCDPAGDVIMAQLEQHGIGQIVTRDKGRPTAQVNIVHFRGEPGLRTIYYAARNANTYDVGLLHKAIEQADLRADDYLFASLYILEQMDRRIAACRPFMRELSAAPGRLIVDLVPHRLYEFCDAEAIRSLLTGDTWLMIGEFSTFFNLIHRTGEPVPAAPARRDCEIIAETFRSEHFSCRYGVAAIGYEILFDHDVSARAGELAPRDTGYSLLPPDQMRGFGDLLTAEAVRALSRAMTPASPVERMETSA